MKGYYTAPVASGNTINSLTEVGTNEFLKTIVLYKMILD